MQNYPNFDGTQACRDPTPEAEAGYAATAGADPSPAQALCGHCTFLSSCRAWSLEHDVRGVWGGLTDDDRRRLRVEVGVAPPGSVSDELDQFVLVWRRSDGDPVSAGAGVAGTGPAISAERKPGPETALLTISTGAPALGALESR